jgi:HEPN domain-containing protein
MKEMVKNNFSHFSQVGSQKKYFAWEFLKIAKQDLIAAKVLHRNELYPEALFFLQQSIEKGYKAFHLLLESENGKGDTTKKDLTLRKISHTPTRISEKIASDAEERLQRIKRDIDSFPNSDEIYAKIGPDYSKLVQHISDSKEAFSDISSNPELSKEMRRHNLNKILDELCHLKQQGDHFIRDIKNITFDEATKKKMKRKHEEICTPIFRHFPEQGKEYNDKINDLFGENFQQIEPIFKIVIQRYVDAAYIIEVYSQLSVITQAHVSSTRYPCINNTPQKEYTRRHPIIQQFNKLIRLADNAHRKFDYLFLPPNTLPQEITPPKKKNDC